MAHKLTYENASSYINRLTCLYETHSLIFMCDKNLITTDSQKKIKCTTFRIHSFRDKRLIVIKLKYECEKDIVLTKYIAFKISKHL